jgi:hypothetical protein
VCACFVGIVHAQKASAIYHQQAFVADDVKQTLLAADGYPNQMKLVRDFEKMWVAMERQASVEEENEAHGIQNETYLEQARRQACDEIASGPTTSLMTPFVNDLHEIEAKSIKPKTQKQKVLFHNASRLVHRYERDKSKLAGLADCAALDAAATP